MQLFPILQKEFSFKMYLPRYSEKDIQLEDFEICVMELKLRENVVGEFCFCFSSLNRINKSQGVPAIEGRIRCSGVEWKWWKRAFAYPRVLHPGWLYDFHTQGVELPRTQKMEMGRQMWRNKIEIQLRFLSRLFGECIMIFFLEGGRGLVGKTENHESGPESCDRAPKNGVSFNLPIDVLCTKMTMCVAFWDSPLPIIASPCHLCDILCELFRAFYHFLVNNML